MSIDRVCEFLRKHNMQDRILEFDVSSATVELAAVAVGCEPARIAKTLSFMVDGHPVLIVAAGDAKVDNARFKANFHTKAKMLTPDEAVELVGHAVGGVWRRELARLILAKAFSLTRRISFLKLKRHVI